MKKIVLLITASAIFHSAFSQLEKGNLLLGGSLGWSNSKTEFAAIGSSIPAQGQKSSNVTLSPNLSYFVTSKLAIGLSPFYSYGVSSGYFSTSNSDTKTNSFLIGPVVRYYFPLGTWAIFPEVSYSLGASKTDRTSSFNGGSSSASSTAQSYILKTGIGLTYFITKSIGVEGKFFYQYYNTNYNTHLQGSFYFPDNHTSSFNYNIGLQFYWNRKSLQ